jgi:hypothetical protein
LSVKIRWTDDTDIGDVVWRRQGRVACWHIHFLDNTFDSSEFRDVHCDVHHYEAETVIWEATLISQSNVVSMSARPGYTDGVRQYQDEDDRDEFESCEFSSVH